MNPAERLLDTVLDRSVVPGWTSLGLAVRSRLAGWPADPAPDALAGRAVVVTGASSGLGVATAVGVARLGGKVHAVVRDVDKARSALAAEGLGDEVTLWRCDLSDLDDVARLADDLVAARDLPLAAVVHNAGVMPPERSLSPQGHELSLAVHVLGPVLLTEGLAPVLAGSRVVLVTSGGMYTQALHLDDLEYARGGYSPPVAYARSKRAQVELLPVLAERWGADGAVVAAMHPGWADTPGVRESLPTFRRVTGPVLRDAAAGADTAVWLTATDEPVPTGRLWMDRRPRPTTFLGRHGATPEERRRLWEWVEDRALSGRGSAGRSPR